jgi:hypothetical protein
MSNILVVDDEVVITEELEMCLQALGYQVVGSAHTGKDAITKARLLRPDLILMDIRMPGGMDGIEAAQLIKKELDIPVIFVTAHTDDQYIYRAKDVEPLGYIIKPFQWRAIRAAVEIALAKIAAEKRLKESEAQYRAVIDHSQGGVAIVRGNKYIYANQRFAHLLGFASEQEIVGQFFTLSEYPDEWELLTYLALQQKAWEPLMTAYEARVQRKNGEIIRLEVSISRTTYQGEALCLVFVKDISDIKKRAEDQLIAKKLEATGILAGGIAHDFNNLLSVILGYVSLAQMDMEPENPVFRLLYQVEKATFRAQELTQKYLTFSTGGSPIKEPTLIKPLLLESIRTLGQDHRIQYNFALAEDLWGVAVDPGQIKQALINIIENAREAMPAGGSIDFAAENLPVNEQTPELSPIAVAGRYVRIKITDHGVGIPKEHLDRIFDPYFSTKDRGIHKGMGLGLSIAHAIIQKHGGYMQVEAEPGLGTTVAIALPASDEGGT